MAGTTGLDVAVIGAGLAGLRAATDLVGAGRDVRVFEARERVGGRVFSHRFPDGQWCERGAEFVDTDHAEVIALAQRLGLELLPVTPSDDARRLLDVGGRAVPFALHHSLVEEAVAWQMARAQLAARVDPDDPVSAADAESMDARPLADVVAAMGLGVAARVAIGRELRTEFMLPPGEVSELMASWMFARHERSGAGYEAFRVRGGNDHLAAGLASPLGDTIELGAEVRRIDADGGIELADGRSFVAEHIVVTVPLPVLGRMWDALPPQLAAVSYGVGGKVSIQVARRVWLDEGRSGSVLSDRGWGEMWETSDGQPGDAGVLTTLLSSHDGAALAALPDVVSRITTEADRLFPGFAGLVGESVHTDWTHDPFSLGAYVTFGPGQLLPAWPLLRRRHGRILLAGEHTDAYAGFMEGALRSGTRAAAAILD